MSPEPKYHISIESISDYNSIVYKGLSMHYFWSESSGTCHIMTPILDQLTAHYKDKLYIYCINLDQNTDVEQYCGITKVPATRIYFDDELKENVIGIVSLSTLIRKIDTLLDY